jgi:hypothetical protein
MAVVAEAVQHLVVDILGGFKYVIDAFLLVQHGG